MLVNGDRPRLEDPARRARRIRRSQTGRASPIAGSSAIVRRRCRRRARASGP